MLQSAIEVFFFVAAVLSIFSILDSLVRAYRIALELAKQKRCYNFDLVADSFVSAKMGVDNCDLLPDACKMDRPILIWRLEERSLLSVRKIKVLRAC